ncbi:Uma2 family endonuclease [Amycolatopsis silviterrae]|uniref:Uma2 family endonuclease n=1 Tax=Amycolatopsis silviterrae TaxID=1656914 RepID=A0ABW5HL42_9PSEU
MRIDDISPDQVPGLAEVLALPNEQLLGTRIEGVDGSLVLGPAPAALHQRWLQRLQLSMAAALPKGTELLPGVNVRCGESRLLIPDFVVVTCPDVATTWYPASEVLLAAEIESPSTRVQDRIFKKALYAEALIPYYLLVDPEQEAATVYALADGDYLPHTKSEDGVLTLAEPFSAELNLRA